MIATHMIALGRDPCAQLADFLSLPPAVLLSHSAALARSPSTYTNWRWADKAVVELGCGIAALPSLSAARNGARRVVCTDGNPDVLPLTRANVARWAGEQPGVEGEKVVAPLAMALEWGGSCDDTRGRLRALGVETPVDVVLAADCIYDL